MQSGTPYGYIKVMQENSEHRPPEDSFSLVKTAASCVAVAFIAVPIIYVGIAVLTVVWPMVPVLACAALFAGVAGSSGSSGQTEDRRKRS